MIEHVLTLVVMLYIYMWYQQVGATSSELQQNYCETTFHIRDETNKIPDEMCENVMNKVLTRARICEANRSDQLSDIVFHT